MNRCGEQFEYASKFTAWIGSPEDPGIIPRAVATIFELADKNRGNVRVNVESYMVELYNDVLIDLYNFQDKKFVHLDGPSKLEISKDAKVRYRIVAHTYIKQWSLSWT